MSMSFNEYAAHDAVGLAELVRTGAVTSRELVDAAISRLEAVNPTINAVAVPLFERARDRAERAPEGPFGGVPFATKDMNHAIAGVPLTNGSRAFAGYVPTRTGELVERYERAGLVFICTSTSCELGLATTTESTLYGPTRNPWNSQHSAGGSSGGAAALVAAGVLPVAHATDGGGSIRIPASACGLFGLKPSRGRTPSGTGRTEGWNGLSCAHAVSRTVRDSAALLDATQGRPFGARTAAPETRGGSFREAVERDPGPLRIAVQRAPFGDAPVAPECLQALDHAAGLCAALGHPVEEARPDIPNLTDHLLVVLATHVAVGLHARGVERGTPVGEDEIESVTALFRGFGAKGTSAALLSADNAFMDAAIAMERFHERYDLLLTPVLGRPPAPLGTVSLDLRMDQYATAMAGYSTFTAYQNMTGQPAMSVPLFWADGLPIGVQFVAPYGREDRLFALAGQLERAQPWRDRRPAL